ncbi:MAG: class I SAM-dependent methyltransferase [Chloroflexi bacterium]|nr:class I SAM-dependent methyltransferase [Chloroflexota bacterium]
MRTKRWLIPLAVVGAIVVARRLLRGAFGRIAENLRGFGAPTAEWYDRATGWALTSFFDRVAAEVAATVATGRILEVGSGPGRLAVLLARVAPSLAITGLDLSPAMVELAARRAARAGLQERVQFEVGDVAALPFPDGSFDGVVSTASLHHWADPARGLAEIHRVLKPGGVALIYDIAWSLGGHTPGRPGLERLAAASPFAERDVTAFPWPGPIPFFARLRLRRADE